jgi:uncharacterized protein YndB with AHSA1/START domain
MNASFSTSFEVDRTPEEVYEAVVDVRSWWFGDIDGSTSAVGDVFSYEVPGIHWSAMRVTELEPGSRVAWEVTGSRLDFADVPDEWTGTTVRFAIEPVDGGTRLRFTHEGLAPDLGCYSSCSAGWAHFVDGCLRTRIATGLPAQH